MAPNPATPSPHRFLTSKPRAPSAQPSTLRNQSSAPSSQFVPTPRFTFGSTQRTTTSHAQLSSPLTRRPIFPRAHPEDIEDAPSDQEDGAATLPIRSPQRKKRCTSPRQQRHDAIVISSSPSSAEEEAVTPPTTPPTGPGHLPTTDIQPKASENDDTIIAEATPTSPLPRTHPRFRLPGPGTSTTSTPFVLTAQNPPNPSSTSTKSHPPIPTRPPIILPPRSPSPSPTQSAFFSPSRKGQKYIPGGMAATVREWVIKVGQSAHHLNRGVGGGGGGEGGRRIAIGKVVGRDGRAMMVEEEVADGDGGNGVEEREERRWVLVADGEKGREGGGKDLEEGTVVEVREPTWEVKLRGKTSRVAVEWRVVTRDRVGEG